MAVFPVICNTILPLHLTRVAKCQSIQCRRTLNMDHTVQCILVDFTRPQKSSMGEWWLCLKDRLADSNLLINLGLCNLHNLPTSIKRRAWQEEKRDELNCIYRVEKQRDTRRPWNAKIFMPLGPRLPIENKEGFASSVFPDFPSFSPFFRLPRQILPILTRTCRSLSRSQKSGVKSPILVVLIGLLPHQKGSLQGRRSLSKSRPTSMGRRTAQAGTHSPGWRLPKGLF